jgi:hypothetical protein
MARDMRFPLESLPLNREQSIATGSRAVHEMPEAGTASTLFQDYAKDRDKTCRKYHRGRVISYLPRSVLIGSQLNRQLGPQRVGFQARDGSSRPRAADEGTGTGTNRSEAPKYL